MFLFLYSKIQSKHQYQQPSSSFKKARMQQRQLFPRFPLNCPMSLEEFGKGRICFQDISLFIYSKCDQIGKISIANKNNLVCPLILSNIYGYIFSHICGLSNLVQARKKPSDLKREAKGQHRIG